MPLLNKLSKTATRTKSKRYKKSGQSNPGFHIELSDAVDDKEYWEDNFDDQQALFADSKKRGTNLIWNDFFILTVEYLQWLALLQSLSLRWPWPEDWVKTMIGLFAFLLDPWEIAKVSSSTTYLSEQDYKTDSKLMIMKYWHVLVGWAVLLFLLAASYIISYIVITKSDHPFLMVKIANMQRAYTIIIQVLALPFGAAIGKIFHCVPGSQAGDENVMYVDNEELCMSDVHWSYMASAAIVAIIFYVAFPVWLIHKTRLELIFNKSAGHEAYLQLKETEYAQGLDIIYIVSGFHIFSSFTLTSAHYRAALHILKFLAVVIYASAFYYTYYQALAMAVLLLIYFISFVILRPFRVKMFNIIICINYGSLVLHLLTGALRSSFSTDSFRSVWFTPEYITYILIILNGIWLLIVVSYFLYILLNSLNCLKKPIWPSLTSDGVEKLDAQTKKFMKGVLVARHVIERSLALPALFAPAHELSRQIQIINAYCREAEILSDPLQDTLWHLLDELIEVHASIAPRSLFSESVKENIRTTASDLMRVMPVFVQRIAQREYDFILVSPVKKRMLLKMYCLGIFLNGRAEKVAMNKVNQSALDKIWNQSRPRNQHDSAKYVLAVLPESEAGPRVGQSPPSRRPRDQVAQEASNTSLSLISEDDESFDVDQMVAGIPSNASFSASDSNQISSQETDLLNLPSPQDETKQPDESIMVKSESADRLTENAMAVILTTSEVETLERHELSGTEVEVSQVTERTE